jgi:hypothetical protein
MLSVDGTFGDSVVAKRADNVTAVTMNTPTPTKSTCRFQRRYIIATLLKEFGCGVPTVTGGKE